MGRPTLSSLPTPLHLHLLLLLFLPLFLFSLLSSVPSARAVSVLEVEQRDLWFAGFNVVAIAVNSSTLDVFAADLSRHAIDRFNQTGGLLTSFTAPPSYGDFDPTSLALFSNTLYAGDESAPRVLRFDVASGALLPPIACPVGFVECGAMSVSAVTGDVWVADQWSVRIARLPAGNLLVPVWTLWNASTPALPVSSIDSLAVDSSGYVYVSDPLTNSVFRISPAGDAIVNLTLTLPANQPPLMQPTALAWNSSSLFVYDAEVGGGSNTLTSTRVTQFALTGTTGTAVAYWSGVQPAFNPAATRGMAVDARGSVYLADFGDAATQGRVARLNAQGNVTASFTAPVQGYANREPAGIVYEPVTCTLFFTDIGNSGVVQMAQDGSILNTFSDPSNSQYSSLAIDLTTQTLVLTRGNGLWRLNPVGSFSYTQINTAAAALTSPTSVAVNGAGQLFVVSGQAVVKLSALGVRDTAWDAAFTAAGAVWTGLSAMTMDSTTANLYVSTDTTVYKLNANATVLGSFALPAAASAPNSLYFDPAGQHLYVATQNAPVLQFDGSVCFRGTGGCAPLGALEPTSPSIFQALGMAMDAAGQFYVTDWNGHRVVVFASGAGGQPLSLSAAQCPRVVQFSYSSSNSSYPSVCAVGTLSCALSLPFTSSYTCGQVLTGNHSYYSAPTLPAIVSPLNNQLLPFTCHNLTGDFTLPISPLGFNLPFGVGCAHLSSPTANSGSVIASPDSISAAVSLTFSPAGAPFTSSCQPSTVVPTPTQMAFVYSSRQGAGGAGFCGAGFLQCAQFGTGYTALSCSSLSSGVHYSLSSSGALLSTSSLTWESACYSRFGDGYLPLDSQGLSLGVSFSSTQACLNLASYPGNGSLALLNLTGQPTAPVNFLYSYQPIAAGVPVSSLCFPPAAPSSTATFPISPSSSAFSSSTPSPFSSSAVGSSALTSSPLIPSGSTGSARSSSALSSSALLSSALSSALPPSSVTSAPLLPSSSAALFPSSSTPTVVPVPPVSSSSPSLPTSSTSPTLQYTSPVPSPSYTSSAATVTSSPAPLPPPTPTSTGAGQTSAALPIAPSSTALLFSSSSAPPAAGSSDGGSNSHVGAIVGGVVGGVAGCCCLLFLLAALLSRRKWAAAGDSKDRDVSSQPTSPRSSAQSGQSSVPMSQPSSQQRRPGSAETESASAAPSLSQPSSDFGTARYGTASGLPYDSNPGGAGLYSTATDASLASGEFPQANSPNTLTYSTDTGRSTGPSTGGSGPLENNDHVVRLW